MGRRDEGSRTRTARSPRRRTFVVGRVTPSATVVRMVEERPAPLPGPWTLDALVRPRERRLRLVR